MYPEGNDRGTGKTAAGNQVLTFSHQKYYLRLLQTEKTEALFLRCFRFEFYIQNSD